MSTEPAFPHDEKCGDGTHWHSHLSMTLRDYFAAKALQGMVVNIGLADIKETARRCYQAADAMLAARADSSPEGNSK